jgi:hypothetical protein
LLLVYKSTVGEEYFDRNKTLIVKSFDEIIVENKELALKGPKPQPYSCLTFEQAELCVTRLCKNFITDKLKQVLSSMQEPT